MIPKEHVAAKCQPGTKSCCRYLMFGGEGFLCGKVNSKLRKFADDRAEQMRAKGDNCEGYPQPQRN